MGPEGRNVHSGRDVADAGEVGADAIQDVEVARHRGAHEDDGAQGAGVGRVGVADSEVLGDGGGKFVVGKPLVPPCLDKGPVGHSGS